MKSFVLDTHVHSCLSPCASLDMHPSGIVEAALRAGLDAVAVCDHNSAENAAATQRAGRAAGIAVIAGMEITSAEEVHVLGLCPTVEAALTLQSRVYRSLPGENDEEAFGLQVVANEQAEVLDFNDRFLAGATTLSIERVVEAIHEVGGLAVASHIDREGFGILGQLGMIPELLPLDGIEISARTPLPVARTQFGHLSRYPLVCSSDAHRPEEVGRAATFMLLEEPTLGEIRQALAGAHGRVVLGGGKPMEDLALHIIDIARNGVEAGATRIDIEIAEQPSLNRLTIDVRDNGRGMDPETAARVADPFFTTRTTRRVGLGLALLAGSARASGGDMRVDSRIGKGTQVTAIFKLDHIDRPPLGDLETTLMVLLAGHPDITIAYRHLIEDRSFELDSGQFREAGISLSSPEGITLMRKAIRQGEAELHRTPAAAVPD